MLASNPFQIGSAKCLIQVTRKWLWQIISVIKHLVNETLKIIRIEEGLN